MNNIKLLVTSALAISLSNLAFADHHTKVLFKEAVAPVLSAKCASCHGDKKQKGKLRVDSLEAIMKGGSEGASVVPGKPKESTLIQRIHLPLDDDEHMPPEDKTQLTKDEVAVLEFWIQSGAKGDAQIGSLKASAEITKSIVAVLAAVPKLDAKKPDAPKKLDDAAKKLIADTIKKVNAGGGNLMAIAQNTPQLRFSALNVAKEFGDQHLVPLKPVGEHILWLDIARTQVTDSGLANVAAMKNLTKLHLENTKITDAGLDHLKGLSNLEYLNLYGTGITDAGIAKLAGLKKLQKLFLWQTKATDKGVAALAKAIPGIDINTGWKEPVKVVAVAATKPATPKPVAKPAPKPPAKPVAKPTPAPKPPAKPVAKPTPAPKPPAKPVAKPTPAPKGTLEAALAELTAAATKAKQDTAAAKAAHELAVKKAAEAARAAEAMKAAAERAANIEQQTATALLQLQKAVAASKVK